jgi:glycosyltransferase involved in cell wall biosynthesis
VSARVERTPLISLIMTVRDGAQYLAQAIESVRAQTFEDWELVVWDDGSTDDTPAIARICAENEPRIRLCSGQPLGRRRALVEAHRQARGAYLGWLDADDWLAPEALARTHAVVARSGCDMVYTDHVMVGPNGERRGVSPRSRIPYSARGLLLDFMTFHFRLFSRDIFERAGGIDPDLEIAIDYDLCLRISEHARIRHLAEPLYFYRQHDLQLSARARARQIAASAAAIRAALRRRGMSTYELVVDPQRGRFQLVPASMPTRPPTSWLRLAVATAVPRLLRSRPARPPRECGVIGYWPAAPSSVYQRQLYAAADARGVHARALDDELALLMRAVWTGRAGDTLNIHGIGPLLEAADHASVRANGHLFVKTLDHALARGMRIVWTSIGPLATHPRHRALELGCRRALVARCHAIVTHWRADHDRLRELGAPPDRIVFVPHPGLVEAYPEVSRDYARAQLGLADRDALTLLCGGEIPAARRSSAWDLTLGGDVDHRAPRDVAIHFAAADVAVLPPTPWLTSGALVLAMSMAKPIVAPSLPGVAEAVRGNAFLYAPSGSERAITDAVERACAARHDWDRIGQANLECARGWRWDAVVAAVTGGADGVGEG